MRGEGSAFEETDRYWNAIVRNGGQESACGWCKDNLEVLSKIYVVAGQSDKAIDTLEQLLSVPNPISARRLAIDPNYAPLRGNPRFEKLIAGKS